MSAASWPDARAAQEEPRARSPPSPSAPTCAARRSPGRGQRRGCRRKAPGRAVPRPRGERLRVAGRVFPQLCGPGPSAVSSNERAGSGQVSRRGRCPRGPSRAGPAGCWRQYAVYVPDPVVSLGGAAPASQPSPTRRARRACARPGVRRYPTGRSRRPVPVPVPAPVCGPGAPARVRGPPSRQSQRSAPRTSAPGASSLPSTPPLVPAPYAPPCCPLRTRRRACRLRRGRSGRAPQRGPGAALQCGERAALAGHLARLGRRRAGAAVRRAVGVVVRARRGRPTHQSRFRVPGRPPASPDPLAKRPACPPCAGARPSRPSSQSVLPPGLACEAIRRTGRVRGSSVPPAVRAEPPFCSRPQGRVSLLPVRHGAWATSHRRHPSRRRTGVPVHRTAVRALAVRGRRHPRLRPSGAGTSRRADFTDPQQRARHEADRAAAHAGAVQTGAVGGAEVAATETWPSEATVTAQCIRETSGSSSRRRGRRSGRAGSGRRSRVDAAGVGAGDHVELGRDVGRLGVRVGLAGGAQAEHGTVGQRGSPRVLRWASSRCAPA